MSPSRLNFRSALALLVLVGVALRLYLIIQSGWRVDYDEAMIGLLGLRVMRGEWMAFVPAQPTLGTLEPYLLAPVFTLFGASTVTFRAVSLGLAAGYIATTGLVGRRAFGDRVGLATSILAAVAPPYLIVASLKTWGSTVETIILGNLLFLTVAYTLDSKRVYGLAAAGFLAGIMFWLAWLGVYYWIPAALLLLWRGRDVLRRGWAVGLAAFLIGSAPFWMFNVQHDFATVTAFLGGEQPAPGEMLDVLRHFIATMLPMLVTGEARWGGVPGVALLMLIYWGGVVTLLLERWHRVDIPGSEALRWMLSFFIVTVPLVYLTSAHSRNALNPWGVDATGRYVVMLHTVLPVGVALLGVVIGGLLPTRRAGQGLIALVLLLNLWGLWRADPVRLFDSPYYGRLPQSLDGLVHYLDENGIRHVWTDRGIGQVLMFETGERILAADYWEVYIADGLVRFPDVLTAVENASRVAFVEPVLPGNAPSPLEQAFEAADIAYRIDYVAPNLAVLLPAEKIDPARVAAGLGYQY